MEQEAAPLNGRSRKVEVPRFLKEILGHLTFEARKSNEINQSSGVSVRVTINNFESIVSNAEKRALRCKENDIVPRISDLHSVLASTNGKIEMEYVGEDKKEDDLVEKLLNRSIVKVFDQYFSLNSLQKVIEFFNSGWGMEVSDQMASQDYLEGIKEIPGLKEDPQLDIQETSDGFSTDLSSKACICTRNSTRKSRAAEPPTASKLPRADPPNILPLWCIFATAAGTRARAIPWTRTASSTS
jgi:hypothetical protein